MGFHLRSIFMAQTSSIARAKDGCQLWYRIYANPGKPRLALIHSLALSGAMWGEVIAQLAGAAEILAYDCRGHGQSERRPGPYSVELFADDFAALLDSGARPAKDGFPSMMEFQLSRWFSDGFRRAHPDVANEIAQIFLANDAASYQAACEMLGNADLRAALRAFRMPVSVIVGEEDYATPVAMAEYLHESIPNSTLTVIRGARHTTPVECPRGIAAVLGDLVCKPAAASR